MLPTPGQHFGPYDILAPLGGGGMGLVFRAKDPRLGRVVALKTLPPESLKDPTRLQRFELEARAVSSLNHPNVLVVYDVGHEGETPYIVTELLEGETLRSRLEQGPLPPREVIDLGLQVAQGLAAVHQQGLVHRDLKPDNLFLTRDGRVKILDFGVARTTESAPSEDTLPLTQVGALLGTAGYMSPEQVRGRVADARSDLFALGAILYECLAGEAAFGAGTAVERGYAVLNHEPPEPEHAPPALWEAITRCLEKSPAKRMESAQALIDALQAAHEELRGAPRPRKRRWVLATAVLALAAALALGAAAALERGPFEKVERPELTARQVSSRSGVLFAARLASDGETLVYAGSFDDGPARVYAAALDGAELRPVSPRGSVLFDLSSSDELLLGTPVSDPEAGPGFVISLAPLGGGAARTLADGVRAASFGPGDTLLVTRFREGVTTLEYPLGTVLVRESGLLQARVSPDGAWIAVAHYPVGDGEEQGQVELFDLTGARVAASRSAHTLQGIAWTPDSREVWFAAGFDEPRRDLYALALDGTQRRVFSGLESLRLKDIDDSGRVLVSTGLVRAAVMGRVANSNRERSLGWLDLTVPVALSPDARGLLFTEGAQTWVRRFDTEDDTPRLLADAVGLALSPDLRWAAVTPEPFSALRLVPTGEGKALELPGADLERIVSARFFADGQQLAFTALVNHQPWLYLQPATGDAPPRQLSPEPFTLTAPPSPDGRWLAGLDSARRPVLLAVADGARRPLEGLDVEDTPVQWTHDGRALWVSRDAPAEDGLARDLLRYELASGKAVVVKRLRPADPVGALAIHELLVTPDGEYSLLRTEYRLDQLFLLEGLQ